MNRIKEKELEVIDWQILNPVNPLILKILIQTYNKAKPAKT